ncbi:MAG: glutamate-5-semialdehyde dehydrogenase, partial [Solirubrobacteraceae bacterium]
MGTDGLEGLARRVRAASREVARAPSGVRDEFLAAAADLLAGDASAVLEANRSDLERAEHDGLDAAALDRLRLTDRRLEQMAEGLRAVSALPDPVGEVVDGWVRPNGLRVERVRVPFGVVGIIYENRPNVTSDAAGLCVKGGNAALLRGSSSALASNRAVVSVLRRALSKAGLPEDAIALVSDTSHETAISFMRLRGLVDCLVPRGGRALIASLLEHATVPYVLDGDGNCHVYVDESADLDSAEAIVVNAKTQRPGVCNAAETLLVHSGAAPALLPRLAHSLADVELVADERARAWLPRAGEATQEDFATEFLALKLAVAVVDDLDAAIAHIARFGSGHSEAIVTRDVASADRFVREVDAAAVLVNASTR